MEGVGMAESAELLELKLFRCRPLVLGRGVVSSFALPAFKRYDFSHRVRLCNL
jgi:hypothetical protein